MLLLFIGLVVLGALLSDARKRLSVLERKLAQQSQFATANMPTEETSWEAISDSAAVPRTIVDANDSLSFQPASPSASLPQTGEEQPDWVTGPVVEAAEQQDEAVPPPTAVTAAAIPSIQSDGGEPTIPAAATAVPPKPHGTWGFEELFGGKLPIWAGGVTLAIAGVMLVKYSIELGLIGPAMRVILGLLFGGGLIAGAEWAYRNAARVQDARVHQALAGAGIATLYASILAAANLYGLVGGGLAFAGLGATTALAMALSLRFGAPSAVLGLVGGLAAPALISAGPPNVPLLCAYLALAIGGLTTLSRRQRWMWLGIAALIGGAGWSLLLILTGALDLAATLSIGALALLLGVGLPLFAFGEDRAATLLRAGAALVAALQIAAIVALGGFAPLQWGLYLLLSAALIWLVHGEAALRTLAPIGLAVGLLLTAIWPVPRIGELTVVLVALGVLYGGSALWRLLRADGRILEAGQIAGLALASYAVALLHHFPYDGSRDAGFALLAIAIAMLPAATAALGWGRREWRADARLATLVTSAGILVTAAGLIGLPEWTAPLVLAAVAAALLWLAGKAGDHRIAKAALCFGVLAIAGLLATDRWLGELGRLAGAGGGGGGVVHAILRWMAIAGGAAWFAWRHNGRLTRTAAQVVAAISAYGVAAQVIPADWLALTAALALIPTAEAMRRQARDALLPALSSFAAIALCWAVVPAAEWGWQAWMSLSGEPLLATMLPAPLEAARHLALPALLGLFALWRIRPLLSPHAQTIGASLAGLLIGIAAHIGYKQIFDLGSTADALAYGLAERTLWQAILLGVGYGLLRRMKGGPARLLPVAALLHLLWYSLLLFNPLWTATAVGAVPVANLLLAALAVSTAGLWVTERAFHATKLRRPFDVARMILLTGFAFALLRQCFAGSILIDAPVSQVENIARSILAILLAIAFLLWGIRRGMHDWRIGSLLLMLGAVAKVFLLDAAGLTGLLRIASFLALGFSLIGIGWLYSRFLRRNE